MTLLLNGTAQYTGVTASLTGASVANRISRISDVLIGSPLACDVHATGAQVGDRAGGVGDRAGGVGDRADGVGDRAGGVSDPAGGAESGLQLSKLLNSGQSERSTVNFASTPL